MDQSSCRMFQGGFQTQKVLLPFSIDLIYNLFKLQI